MRSPTRLMTREPSLAVSGTRASTRPIRRSLAGGTKLLRGGSGPKSFRVHRQASSPKAVGSIRGR
jgi:hypothetical protein